MATNTVASMAIKLGIDASTIPAQLRGLTVTLTTEQRRMAADQKKLASEILESTREHAEKEVAERKWAADATLQYERQIAAKRAEVERRLQEEMAAENAKTKSRGFASIMLASNAAGAGIPFPLARILSSQFPGVTELLSGFIGLAGAGVGLKVIVDIFEKITHKLEEAKRKEEDYQNAVQKTKLVIGEANAASELRLDKALAKAAALRGDKKEQVRFEGLVADSGAIAETAKAVEKLGEAELKESRAAEARMLTWAALERVAHRLFNSSNALGVEKINDQMEQFGREFSLRAVEDEINHTTTAHDLLAKSYQNAKDQLAALQAQQAAWKPTFTYSGPGAGAPDPSKDRVSNEKIAAAQALVKLYADIDEHEARRKKAADQEKANEAVEAAKTKRDTQVTETRRQIEAIDKLVNSLRDKAAAEALAAEATGKGSAASIRAAAAATAEKDIADRLAEADEKFKLGEITAKQLAQVKSALDAATPAVREFALAFETAKAGAEYSRALAEFNLRTREHIAALDAEAAAVGRVAKEQAKQGEGLVALQERYEGLYGKTVPPPAPPPGSMHDLLGDMDVFVEGPGKQQEDFSGLQAARGGVATEQSKTQATAFTLELQKVQAATIEASDPSPWNRTESKLAAIKIQLTGIAPELSVTAEQMAQLGAAMHAADAAGALEKLKSKSEELGGVHRALLAGSPYPQIEAEVKKLASDYHIPEEEVRKLLTTTQELANANKAIEALRAVQPGGAGSRIAELEREAAIVRQMAAEQQDNANVQLAARLRLQEITAEEDAILLRTGGVADGFRAWLDELKAVESEAQIVKAMLDQATKGLESTAADALVKIIETHRGQHQKLIHELRQMWESYFAGLAKMAIQHGLQKLLAPVAGAIEKALGITPKDAAVTLNTTAITANTAAINALILAWGARSAGGGSNGLLDLIPGLGGLGGGASAAGSSALGDVSMSGPLAFAAEGGDFSPGGSFISGEAGAERVDLERGGAHVTPLGGTTTGGGDTHHHYDMRGAVVTDDLMRKADAAEMAQHTERSAVAKAVSISREAGLRSRGQQR